MQLWELFVDDELIDHIVACTNLYAGQMNNPFRTHAAEMRTFIAILYVTGIIKLPSVRNYWAQSVTGLPFVKDAISRDRFLKVKQFIHVCNNNELDPNNKFAKIVPFNAILNRKCMQFGVFAHHLSIDEQMISYFGRHSCKMFIRGKPIRFGFKYWDLCSSEGYCFQFLPYAGASQSYKNDLGLGENVVMQLMGFCAEPKHHTVSFDNFFTSHKLMVRLNSQGYFAVGTVRENRTSKAPVMAAKEIKKEARGHSDAVYDHNNKITAVRWNDNAVSIHIYIL